MVDDSSFHPASSSIVETGAQLVDLRSWEAVEEIRSGARPAEPGVEMLLQRGFYRADGARGASVNCRLLWRVNGMLQVRSPRQDELGDIDALFATARAKGWE